MSPGRISAGGFRLASNITTGVVPITLDDATMAGLQSSHGVLQSRVNSELRLKHTPQLTFEYDPTVERGVRLSRLIDELNSDETT